MRPKFQKSEIKTEKPILVFAQDVSESIIANKTDYFDKNIDLLSNEGRLVNIAFLRGNSVKLDLSQLMTKRIQKSSSFIRLLLKNTVKM